MYIIYYYLKGQSKDVWERKRAIVSAESVREAEDLLLADYFAGAIEIDTVRALENYTVLLLDGRN